MNESDPILPFDPDPSAPDTELPLTPGQTPARESPRVRLGRETVVGVQTLLSAAVYATLIVTFVVQVARVDGMSMAPTLEDHDRLIVNKLSTSWASRGPATSSCCITRSTPRRCSSSA
jgi:hypothetical protein